VSERTHAANDTGGLASSAGADFFLMRLGTLGRQNRSPFPSAVMTARAPKISLRLGPSFCITIEAESIALSIPACTPASATRTATTFTQRAETCSSAAQRAGGCRVRTRIPVKHAERIAVLIGVDVPYRIVDARLLLHVHTHPTPERAAGQADTDAARHHQLALHAQPKLHGEDGRSVLVPEPPVLAQPTASNS
jgi:hypothetical protein